MIYIQSFFSLIAYTGKNCESEIVICRNTTCLNNGTYSSELTSDREINIHCHCSVLLNMVETCVNSRLSVHCMNESVCGGAEWKQYCTVGLSV